MWHSLTEITRHRWVAPLYGGVIVALGLGQMIRKVVSDTGGFGSRYALVLLGAVVTIGLVARSRGIRLGSPWLWRVVLLVALVGLGVMLAVEGSRVMAGLCLGGAALLAPGWAGLWDYGFRSPALWSASHTGPDDD